MAIPLYLRDPFATYKRQLPDSYEPNGIVKATRIFVGGTVDFTVWSGQETTISPGWQYTSEYDQTSNIILFGEVGFFGAAAAWKAVQAGYVSTDDFIEKIKENARYYGQSQVFQDAIEILLQYENIDVARRLATIGLQSYPENEALQNYAKALAPPKLMQTGTNVGRDHSKSLKWLSINSGKYVGQWVALRDGVLICTAPSRKLLVEMLGNTAKDESILLSRIPEY
jgi:hypothetical protein